MLICYRRTKSDTAYLKKLVWLTHDLAEEELQWFKRKYTDLERNHREKRGVDPKTLIAFNIMKENFNTEYIKRAVRKFLEDIIDPRERSLLKHVSLINSFDIDFHPVPLPSFDPIMVPAQTMRHSVPGWETQLSTCVRILLNQKPTQGLRGQIKGLRVFSSLMSDEILQSLLETTTNEAKPQTVSEAMIEFLNSSVMKSKDNSNKQMWNIIRNLMKKRTWLKPGTRAKFSPLITAICEEEGVDEAAEVMITVFELTEDPMVAQGIARLYIHAENWPKAEEYARIYTNLIPTNSYVWDTYGQVFKSKIETLYNDYVENFTSVHVPTDDDLKAIDDAFTGIEKFRREQRESKNEKRIAGSNKAGYFGEIQITIILLDFLGFLSPFENKENLHLFLVHQDFKISEAEDRLGKMCCQRLKQLYKDSCDALISLEDEFLNFKDGIVDDYRREMHRIDKNRLIKLEEYHDVHFGENQDRIPANMVPEDAPAFRRRRVIRLGGLSLGKILDVRDKQNGHESLLRMHGLLLKNVKSPMPETFDFKGIIGVSLALSTLNTTESVCTVNDLIRWSKALYELVKDEEEGIELEAYLYMVMFHWPTEDGYDRFRCPSGTLQSAIKRWREAFFRKYPRQKELPPIKKKETTIYHLGNGSDLNQYTHFEQLHGSQGRRLIKGAQIWTNPETVRRLKLLQGTLINQGNDVRISIRSTEGNVSQITIPSGIPIQDKSIWNKHVFFFLGFSWAGPRAYGITGDDPRQMSYAQASPSQPVPPRLHHQGSLVNQEPSLEVTFLLSQLRQIEESKRIQRQKGVLRPDQLTLIKQEGRLKKSLENLVLDRSKVFSETELPYEIFY